MTESTKALLIAICTTATGVLMAVIVALLMWGD
jgi:hypothetical protein